MSGWRTRIELILLGLASLSLIVPPGRAADSAAVPPIAAKRIALTFDDVPRGAGAFLSPQDRAGMLITAFQNAGVRQVAFFVNPSRVGPTNGSVPMIDAYVASGHVIADHSYTHPRLTATSATAYLADIDKAEAWLKGRPGYRPWYRFPFLDEGGRDKTKRDAVRAGLAARGLRHAYVTVDGSDWNIEAQAIAAKHAGRAMDLTALRDLYIETMVQSADFSDALVRRAIGRSPPHVMLLHETDIAAMFMPDLIRALRRDGWEIVTADAAYADPIYNALPDAPIAAGTLPEMLAWQHHVTGMRWYDRNDIKVGDALFQARVLRPQSNMGIVVRGR